MSVYVDSLAEREPKDEHARAVGKKYKQQWCHMWADDLDELHEMAESIGMKRAWFQDHTVLPHYDLLPPKRADAVKEGAIEVGMRELMLAIQNYNKR